MKPIIIFFGNTKFSAIGEQILHEKLGIAYVVTIPDRLDKKNNPLQSPTKRYAIEHGIPVIETDKLTTEIIDLLASFHPDFLVVEDYGLILPKRLLALPTVAPLNVHHSLLPNYRGPTPAPTAIRNGETVSGVSVIHMNERVDAGDIYAQHSYTLAPDETTESLLTVLNTIGGQLVVSIIDQLVAGTARPIAQNESDATFTKMLQKSDGYIDINNPPSTKELDRMIRAYFPWPGVWTRIQDGSGQTKSLKLLPEKKIHMEGKKPVSLKEFYNGYPQLREKIKTLLGE